MQLNIKEENYKNILKTCLKLGIKNNKQCKLTLVKENHKKRIINYHLISKNYNKSLFWVNKS